MKPFPVAFFPKVWKKKTYNADKMAFHQKKLALVLATN